MSKQMSKQIDKQIGKQTNNKRLALKKGQIDILEVLYWCRFGVLVVLGWVRVLPEYTYRTPLKTFATKSRPRRL